MASNELPKHYDSTATEQSIYQRWLDSGFFNPDALPNQNGTPFCIIMPPPNATGILHAGHALFLTIQDILTRYQRMRGRRVLWLPGTDHAAIATQSRVEKEISKKEGKTRHDLGREELLRRIGIFVEEHRRIMEEQMRALGASCDWSREAFTLDEARNHAVTEAFKRLYEMGLIVRGNRIVNWDPKGQTTISDDEIVYEERPAKLWTFRYNASFPIPIATTRPETKLGDTGVAVHPDDDRYKEYIGKEYDVNFCGTPLHIKVVGDKEVDPAFGTGAVGITPAHSTVDWEIAQRHSLPIHAVINEYARISLDGPYKDMKVAEAREKIVAQLAHEGLLEKTEDIIQNIATAERTGGIIEPLPKLQWFIAVNKPFSLPHSEIEGIVSGEEVTLKRLMRHVVESGQIQIIPERFSNNYFHWINNLRDWCISRQIWYGHRVPVWHRGDEIAVGEAPGADWVQDEDTLDTWFSSGLWTFSTLGWPKNTKDLQTYHPTDVMETAYEILFFWVARMILMSTALIGQIPFRTVYLHGLVRDEKRAKLSKSKADSADPLDLIASYGTDALRMALVFNTAPGTDSILSEQKIKGMKHFANKLWNIARYILLQQELSEKEVEPSDADRDISEKLLQVQQSVTEHLESFQIHEAAQEIYQFVWHELADVYLEANKENPNTRMLSHVLDESLKLLHPFMPFVTEELWGRIHGTNDPKKLLMVQQWPGTEDASQNYKL